LEWWEAVGVAGSEWRESEFIESYMDRQGEDGGGKGKGVERRGFI
jgi:hypothetical protein